MTATPVFSNKHCEVVWFNIGREWTAREEKYLRSQNYPPEKVPWNNPNKDNRQLNIIVYDGVGRKIGELVYTTWAFSSCSSATLAGLTKGVYFCAKEEAWKPIVADVIDAILACERASGYPCHRFFCNVPSNRSSQERLWHWLLKFCFPKGLDSSYRYENRAHSSSQQHLYDVNTDVLAKWAKDYHESLKPVEASSSVASGPVVNQPVPTVATMGGNWLLNEFEPAIIHHDDDEPAYVRKGGKL